MKTTIVPAQITTVEDRIIENLTLQQIVLLVISLIIGAAIYALVPVKMHVNIIKLLLVGLQFVVCGGLAVRIRGRIVADWLVLYLRYNSRPRRYIFTKNDPIGREIETIEPEKKMVVARPKPKPAMATSSEYFPVKTKIDSLLADSALSISFKLAKKGGIDVSLKPVKR